MPVEMLADADMFALEACVLVNPVNCVGVMGAGLALAFKERFPANFLEYRRTCAAGKLRPGGILVVHTGLVRPRFIANIATKDHWRDSSRIEFVRAGALALAAWARTHDVRLIACPALGCGKGGLSWTQVKPILGVALGGLENTTVQVLAPHAASPSKIARPWRHPPLSAAHR